MFQKQMYRVGLYSIIFVMSILAIGSTAWVAQAQSAVPDIIITAVERNNTVTISGKNFLANQTFNVRMGPFGRLGINGAVSSTIVETGNGTFSASVAIPAAVQNVGRIAVRLDAPGGYNAYNWFWYSNGTVC